MRKILFISFILLLTFAIANTSAATLTPFTPLSASATVNSADANNTIDGLISSAIWQAAGSVEACITYDLGSALQVGGIQESSWAYPANPFTLFASTDNVNFSFVTSGTLTQNQTGFGEHLFAITTAQYLQVCIQRTNSTGYGELSEFRALIEEITDISVDVDIKPGSNPNCINNNGHGVIPVGILGSASFDVSQVDPTTVQLQGLSVRAVGKKGNLQASISDVNNDGYNDLIVQIEDEDGVFTEGQTEATVTGNLYDGTAIIGSDTLCIVP